MGPGETMCRPGTFLFMGLTDGRERQSLESRPSDGFRRKPDSADGAERRPGLRGTADSQFPTSVSYGTTCPSRGAAKHSPQKHAKNLRKFAKTNLRGAVCGPIDGVIGVHGTVPGDVCHRSLVNE